jgi:DNA-binding transcriptional LysR family regulator
VSLGLGISILPKRMLEKQLQQQEIAAFSIKDMDLQRHYSLVYHENKFLSPAMRRFFEMTMELNIS